MRGAIRRTLGVAGAMLICSSAAMAAGAGATDPTQAWVTAGPGGAQVADGYDLATVFSDRGVWYYSFTPEPDASSVLAVSRVDDTRTGEMTYAIVRMTPRADGRLTRRITFDFEDLRDSSLWSDGLVPDGRTIGAGSVSVAPGGDTFIGAVASLDGRIIDQTLVRQSPDGSLQKVASSADVVAADVFGTPVVAPSLVASAVADDRLYARAEGWDGASDRFQRLVQIVDPDSDGEWSDRQIRPIVLPGSVPPVEDGVYDWSYGGFVPLPADRETGGTPGAAKALLPAFSRSEYRVYRLTDASDDGVLTGPGEAELVFRTQLEPGSLDPWSPPQLAVVASPSGPTFVIAGLSDPSRVSLITEDGAARDVVRSLFAPSGLVALADGSILVGTSEESPAGPARQPYSILRLVAGAQRAGASSASSTATRTLASPGRRIIPRARLTRDVPRIMAWVWAAAPKGGDADMLLLYGADGSGPRDALPGVQEPWSGPCQSADGSTAAAWAEVDVPNEHALYLFDTSAQDPPRMISQRNGMIYCPFPPGALALHDPEPSLTVSRLSLEEDHELTPLVEARRGLGAAVTEDGRSLAVASGDGSSLSIVDVVDGSVRLVAEGLDGTVVRSDWTPDGSRLAFVTGPYDPMQVETSVTGTFEVSVVDVAAGTPPQQLFALEGPAPDVSWSADGRSLAVQGRESETPCGCERAGTLTVVDTLTGDTRTVAPDATFAEWSPVDPAVFAWGNATTLSIEIDGVVQAIEPPVVRAAKGDRPAAWSGFAGWSPDGRYLGFGYPRLMTVDTATGTSKVILEESDDLSLISAEWWR